MLLLRNAKVAEASVHCKFLRVSQHKETSKKSSKQKRETFYARLSDIPREESIVMRQLLYLVHRHFKRINNLEVELDAPMCLWKLEEKLNRIELAHTSIVQRDPSFLRFQILSMNQFLFFGSHGLIVSSTRTICLKIENSCSWAFILIEMSSWNLNPVKYLRAIIETNN